MISFVFACFRNQNPFCSYLFTVILWIQIFVFFFTNVHSSSIWTCERFKSRNRYSVTSSQCSPAFFSHADTVSLSTPVALPVQGTAPISTSDCVKSNICTENKLYKTFKLKNKAPNLQRFGFSHSLT